MMVLYEVYKIFFVLDVKAHALKKLVEEALAVLARLNLNLVGSVPKIISL